MFFVGMAAQALIVALLMAIKALKPTATQQTVAGIVFIILAFVL